MVAESVRDDGHGNRHGVGKQLRTAGVGFVPVVGHQDETRAAYDGVVELYASMFADRLETQPLARAMVGTFAATDRPERSPGRSSTAGPGSSTRICRDGMEDRLGALGLVLNALVLFNTRCMDAAVTSHTRPTCDRRHNRSGGSHVTRPLARPV